MTLTNEAYLELEAGDGTVALFEFSDGLEFSGSIERNFAIGPRGQAIREIDRFIQEFDLGLSDSPRRTAYWYDGGGGTWTEEVSFEASTGEDLLWGDRESPTAPANVTRTDASGADVNPISRYQVMENWLARVRTDSFGYARLHWGEYTDGSVGGVSAGAFESAMPIAIQNSELQRGTDDPSAMSGTLTVAHVAVFPFSEEEAAQWVEDNINLQGGVVIPQYIPDE